MESFSCGDALASIDRTGKAPGEYLYITDFTIDREDILILSRTSRKI
ncbi:MAG: 6-bladed beta-propeller [Bacteroidales bacterium]|nr:6-bladed beta-propeller [Bacteroidales bacterium]